MLAVLLLGLDDLSAETISNLSVRAGYVPRRESMRTTWESKPEADVIFLSADQNCYCEALVNLRQFQTAPPVIVVSRLGDASGWIEALGAGATDYLTAPYTLPKLSTAIRAAVERPQTLKAKSA